MRDLIPFVLVTHADFYSRKIFPRTLYVYNAVRMNSAGAIMREQARVRRRVVRKARHLARDTPAQIAEQPTAGPSTGQPGQATTKGKGKAAEKQTVTEEEGSVMSQSSCPPSHKN